MSGNRILLDSNIIIDAAKGIISIEKIIKEYDFIYTSIICFIEVLGYNFENDREEKIIKEILDSIETIYLDKEIVLDTIKYRKKAKIKLPDAVILATAKHLDAILMTSNVDDFKKFITDIKIIKPNFS